MSKPYFETAGGLRFSCTRCGNCCTRPGPVYFPKPDLERAAAFLGLTAPAFRRRFRVTRIEGVEALDPPDGEPCVFHDPETGCTIYEGRPTQCRTWPFWTEVVGRKRSWEKAGRHCPGIGQGPLHTPRAIELALELCEVLTLPEGDPW